MINQYLPSNSEGLKFIFIGIAAGDAPTELKDVGTEEGFGARCIPGGKPGGIPGGNPGGIPGGSPSLSSEHFRA